MISEKSLVVSAEHTFMGAHKSSFKEKVAWMVTHAGLWVGWPNAPYSDDYIKRQMVKDGLISDRANMYDIMDFGKLVAESRSELRKRHLSNKKP